MHKFYKHKFYKKYKDEIWGRLVLSNSFSYNKRSVLMNYKQKLVRRYIKMRSKYSYHRKGFLKNLRKAVFLNKLARRNSRLLNFNIKRAVSLINKKSLRVKKRLKVFRLRRKWSYYSYKNKYKFSKKGLKKKWKFNKSIKYKAPKAQNKRTKLVGKLYFKAKLNKKKIKTFGLRSLSSFKSLLFVNSNLIFSNKPKKKSNSSSTALRLFKPIKVIDISNSVQLSLKKRFLDLNTSSFLIKKKFNLKNNKSFFYSVHVASPQKKIKKWSNFGLKMIYYKKVSLFLGFKKVSSFVKFYRNSSRFWGENEFLFYSLLERRLETFILRANLIDSVYFVKKFIENGNVMVNNARITNSLRVLQLGEIVSINRRYKKLIYFSLKSRLLKKKVILNFPDFMELDYKLLVGMVTRHPSVTSLTRPISFDLYTNFLSIINH